MENNLENNQECSICLECIKEDKHKIWTCDHSFYKLFLMPRIKSIEYQNMYWYIYWYNYLNLFSHYICN